MKLSKEHSYKNIVKRLNLKRFFLNLSCRPFCKLKVRDMETTKENIFEKNWVSYSQNNIIFQFDLRSQTDLQKTPTTKRNGTPAILYFIFQIYLILYGHKIIWKYDHCSHRCIL